MEFNRSQRFATLVIDWSAFSDEMEQRRHQAKQYLLQELYHATYLERDHALAEEIIAGLFQYWMQNPLRITRQP